MSIMKLNYDSPEPYIKFKTESDTEVVLYSALYESIPEKVKHYAEKELGETEENKVKGIHKLKVFLKKEDMVCSDETLLLAVLRCCKYNIKKSENKLKVILNHRQQLPEMLSKIGMNKVELVIDDIMFGVLPYRDKFGRVITFTRPNLEFEKLFSMDELMLCVFVFHLFLISYPMTSICGLSYIGENKCSSQYALFRQLQRMRQSFITFLVAFPIRHRRSDIINENFITRWFTHLLSPFYPKLVQRTHFHGSNIKGLQKVFHPDILPDDFGGTLGPISNKFYREKFLEFVRNLVGEYKENNCGKE